MIPLPETDLGMRDCAIHERHATARDQDPDQRLAVAKVRGRADSQAHEQVTHTIQHHQLSTSWRPAAEAGGSNSKMASTLRGRSMPLTPKPTKVVAKTLAAMRRAGDWESRGVAMVCYLRGLVWVSG
jgi:hypothetical protein